MNKTIGFRLSEEELKQLSEYSAKEGRTVSSSLRFMIKRFFENG